MEKISNDVYEFSAVVINERYYNDSNNYGIYGFTTNDKLPYLDEISDFFGNNKMYCGVATGNCQKLTLNKEYTIKAKLVFNQKFGWQYQFINVKSDIPTTVDSTRDYLNSILTEKQTTTLLNEYPNIVNLVMEDSTFEPDYKKLKGITERNFSRIKEKIIDTYVISDILSLLHPLGATFNMIKKIAMNTENTTLLKQKLINNPYSLIGLVPRLTFIKIDKFALELNRDLINSDYRVYSCIKYIITKTGEDDGDTLIPLKALREKCKLLIPQAMDKFDAIIEEEREKTKNNEINELYVKDNLCGSAYVYRMEKYIYDTLHHLSNVENNYKIDNFDEIIVNTNEAIGFTLSDEQTELVKSLAENNVLVVSGKAGAGKSTVLRGIVNAYSNYRIYACSLSAKAARRITEVAKIPASTIHKLLGFNGTEFTFDSQNQMSCDILIIDEASMVNTYLFYSLLKALPKTSKLVIVGDHLQLPPIGAGAPFFDILGMNIDGHFKQIRLNTVYRQAQESGIIVDANKIREGIMPFDDFCQSKITGSKKDMRYLFKDDYGTIQDILVYLFMQYIEHGTKQEDISLIVPRREGVVNSTKNINKRILDELIPRRANNFIQIGEKEFRKGCRVINVANTYDAKDTNGEITPVLNGELGFVINFEKKVNQNKDTKSKESTTIVYVKFDDGRIISYENDAIYNLDLGYCLTVHKKQGDQSKVVIIGLDKSHTIMLSSNLLYTAITRAEENCFVIAQYEAFCRGVRNKKEQRRVTFLSKYEMLFKVVSNE